MTNLPNLQETDGHKNEDYGTMVLDGGQIGTIQNMRTKEEDEKGRKKHKDSMKNDEGIMDGMGTIPLASARWVVGMAFAAVAGVVLFGAYLLLDGDSADDDNVRDGGSSRNVGKDEVHHRVAESESFVCTKP
jgi:hypothetical protein